MYWMYLSYKLKLNKGNSHLPLADGSVASPNLFIRAFTLQVFMEHSTALRHHGRHRVNKTDNVPVTPSSSLMGEVSKSYV